jgi:hypothetical protein
MRIQRVGFGTGGDREGLALERGTTPTLSRRSCSRRYELQSRWRDWAGVKRRRELISHPMKPYSADSAGLVGRGAGVAVAPGRAGLLRQPAQAVRVHREGAGSRLLRQEREELRGGGGVAARGGGAGARYAFKSHWRSIIFDGPI